MLAVQDVHGMLEPRPVSLQARLYVRQGCTLECKSKAAPLNAEARLPLNACAATAVMQNALTPVQMWPRASARHVYPTQIEAMRQACLQQLTNHITIDTVFPCYSAAEAVSENKLSAACIAFTACPANRCVTSVLPHT